MNSRGAVVLVICGYTDRQTNRHGEAEMCQIDAFENQPSTSVRCRKLLFLWCTTVEILPVIYRDKTRRQMERCRLLDTFSLTFLLCTSKAQNCIYYSVLFAIERTSSVEVNPTKF